MKATNNKTKARKVLNIILQLYVALSFWGMFLAGAEREDGSISLLWSLSWITNAAFALHVVAPKIDTGDDKEDKA